MTYDHGQLDICYCGEYGGGVHTRSARCPKPTEAEIAAVELELKRGIRSGSVVDTEVKG
jgi:hypothetical protein